MGQYFHFYNKCLNVDSEKGCSWNFGLSWAKNMNRYSRYRQRQIFEEQIAENLWSKDHVILAVGDEGCVIRWEDVKDAIKSDKVEEY